MVVTPRGPLPTAPPADQPADAVVEASTPTAPPQVTVGTARGVIATSTGVYLVGSVYTDDYYGRMSIDANALDLTPPFIALQAFHVLQSLLVYPVLLEMIERRPR